jgi:hypothetical protein
MQDHEIFGDDEAHAKRVALAYDNERAKREARRMLAAIERGPVLPPAALTLRERLARPRAVTPWRIEHWQPAGSRIVLAAQFKAGKTTLITNYVRSLVDRAPFLGHGRVTGPAASAAVMDFEMGEQKLDDWYRDAGIEHDDQVVLMPMRGRAASFAIEDPDVRREWATRFRALGTTDLILDCLRPVLDALGLDEHRDAGRFLAAFDALLNEAGISNAVVVHHMGHAGERSRGDSRLRDWPDVEWRLMRQDEDPSSPRFITAYGRDVDVPESQLEYNAVTRHLTIAGGSRQDAAHQDALGAICDLLVESEAPLSGRSIWAALEDSGHPRAAIRAALGLGVRTDALAVMEGPRRSRLYRVGQCATVRRECASAPASECAAPYIGRRTRALDGNREGDRAGGALDETREGHADERL